ncbi:uncharacterized protein LOC120138596 [Hibiscus syriacus]|uniref:uncharacterized protein LOC120138596 n=1 Tax=Hibiscus syriacus TaxID=106335 RepID=UPI00192337D0|nr:uncharacterized protein LOC120138596 [Hibiscus syriacus]
MRDWAAPLIASALFAFLSPGLILQIPGKNQPMGFMNMKTSVASIFVHAVLYAVFLILFLVVLHIHLPVLEQHEVSILYFAVFCSQRTLRRDMLLQGWIASENALKLIIKLNTLFNA